MDLADMKSFLLMDCSVKKRESRLWGGAPPHLNGRLVGPQLCFQPLVLLPQILHSCQITSIVLRTHQQLLFPGEDGG